MENSQDAKSISQKPEIYDFVLENSLFGMVDKIKMVDSF